ncbi:MAG: response regulator [Spirochaetes bacterium]|nr:response regulator [Spirochaetota bacterium]
MKILFIEDNKDLLELLKEALSSDHIINIASSGKDGLFLIYHEKPDLIFLDIMMKGLNGFDVLKMIRKDNVSKDIPVYVISALTDNENIEKTKELGANGYIKKPFKISELKDFINKLSNGIIDKNKFSIL